MYRIVRQAADRKVLWEGESAAEMIAYWQKHYRPGSRWLYQYQTPLGGWAPCPPRVMSIWWRLGTQTPPPKLAGRGVRH